MLYVVMLRNSGRADEAHKLYDGVPTPYNMYWFVQASLLPKIIRMRKAGMLKMG